MTMNDDISPEAFGDCLAVVAMAPKSVIPVSVIEMHLFAYLACILALFGGKPVAEWGYRFALTKEGFPFSPKLEEARNAAVDLGLLVFHPDATMSGNSPDLSKEMKLLMELTNFSDRCTWIKTATECTLALPLGSIRFALESLPSIRAATKLSQNHALLQQYEIDQLYDEYAFVSKALEGDAVDPLSPAVIWLSARLLENVKGYNVAD